MSDDLPAADGTIDPTVLLNARREPADGAERAGPSLGRFVMGPSLGVGGMARVWEATDPTLDRTVAIKVAPRPDRLSPQEKARFVREATLTAQLAHPNIVPVHELGEAADGTEFLVMKKVEGRSLAQLLRALRTGSDELLARWSRYRLLSVFVQVCHAVGYAHAQGVLHRDLKPSNVMLGPFGEVLVMDWGIAWRLGELSTDGLGTSDPFTVPPAVPDQAGALLTQPGVVLGTPGYMSPEQCRGWNLGPTSDVWSLGAVLFELLTGERAVQGETPEDLMRRAATLPPRDPRDVDGAPPVPEEIARITSGAMALRPDDRPDDASALGAAVDAYLAGSRRRAAAAEHFDGARRQWSQYQFLGEKAARLLDEEAQLAASTPTWAQLEDKADLLAVRQRLRAIPPERERLVTDVLAQCDRALTADPDMAAARTLLAQLHFRRFEEAERDGRKREQRLHASLVRQYDTGALAPKLEAPGTVLLRTEPRGATVTVQRFDRDADPVWTLDEPDALGTTPLRRELSVGSYLLTVRADGFEPMRYPVRVERGTVWSSGRDGVPLRTSEEIGDGFRLVPAGAFVFGGDPNLPKSGAAVTRTLPEFAIAEYPVTMAEYAEFLRSIAQDDPELAWARSPRTDVESGHYFERPADGVSWRVPDVDRDGDRWDPRYPVFGVSWNDAVACAVWRSARDGRSYSLPLEAEWEKAARGVDGRGFPWGDTFDPVLCKMRHSRSVAAQPEPVGAFATDRSVYGVADVAGSMRTWCDDRRSWGTTEQRRIRGGCWHALEPGCRATWSYGYAPWVVHTNLGIRLVHHFGADVPEESD